MIQIPGMAIHDLGHSTKLCNMLHLMRFGIIGQVSWLVQPFQNHV